MTISPEAIRRMSSRRHNAVITGLPKVLYPLEQPLVVALVERSSENITMLAITNWRLITLSRNADFIFDVPLSEINGVVKGRGSNLSVSLLDGRKVKLGFIQKPIDAPILLRLLHLASDAPDRIREQLRGELSQAAAAIPGGHTLTKYAPLRGPLPHLTSSVSSDTRISEGNLVYGGIIGPHEVIRLEIPVLLLEGAQPGHLLITNERLLAISEQFKLVAEIPLTEIEGFEAQVNELFSVAADGDSIAIGFFDKPADARQVKYRLPELVTAAKAQRPLAPQLAPGVSVETDLAKRLLELANLHSQGILTDAEFSAYKAKALGI
ncbi:MAG: hypothetical protein FWG25_06105 [Promicromonosporaceae bacterium]|nr:hypothetical protein [Promicromonosporaceae bacterium]